MTTHSSILAWGIPWLEEPGRLQSTGSQRVGHNWTTSLHFPICKTSQEKPIRSCYWNNWHFWRDAEARNMGDGWSLEGHIGSCLCTIIETGCKSSISIVFWKIILLIFGCESSLLCGLFSSCNRWELLSSCGKWASHCGSFFLWLPGSRAEPQMLRFMGLVAPWDVVSSRIRDWTHVSCIGRWILNLWATRGADGFSCLSVLRTNINKLAQTAHHFSLRPWHRNIYH